MDQQLLVKLGLSESHSLLAMGSGGKNKTGLNLFQFDIMAQSSTTREPRKFAGFPREFVTLRVAQFVLKLAHLAISMEPRGPCTCSLLPRL